MSLSRKLGWTVAAAVALLMAPAASAEEAGPPGWAYPLNPTKLTPPVDDGAVLHVPDSDIGLPRAAITDRFGAVDWRPASHPPMPEIVAHGLKPDVWACGFCHYPNGQGRPENAGLAGLPAKYIEEQVIAIQAGLRNSAQTEMIAPMLMKKGVAHLPGQDLAAAAAYFASLKFKPWIRVVESETAPRTKIAGVSFLAPIPDGAMEPIGDRIVEVPEDPARSALRDDAAGFIAYVPPGSLKVGQALAETASDTRQPCATCHGEGLRGGDTAPPVAGRSPSYLFRQLYDIRAGTRTGEALASMAAEVSGLSDADLRSLVAYVANLTP